MSGKSFRRKAARGHIEVITGPMYSGKTEELIRRIRRVKIAGMKVQVFVPAVTMDQHGERIVSHTGWNHQACLIVRPHSILDELHDDTEIVAIDEAQFFDHSLIQLCQTLASEKGIRVIVAGLDLDFRAEPFGPMPLLMSVAERLDKLNAICTVCGEPASRTQRIIDGEPAAYDDPVVKIGSFEMYEARCRRHHVVPGRPSVIERKDEAKLLY